MLITCEMRHARLQKLQRLRREWPFYVFLFYVLYHNTLALQALRTLATMAHFFKQMYSDNIFNLEEQFTPKELTAAITVELIARKIKEIERKHTNTGELCSWWNCCEEAKSHIGKEHIWILIVEAFKILKYEEPPTKCRNIFEQTFKLSYLTLHTLSTSIKNFYF